MKAMVCPEINEDVGVLRLEDVPVRDPGPGEIRVTLRAASVNFPDILMIQGKYQFKPPLPFSPGMEGAGVVNAVGAGVTTVREGDAVVTGARFGTFAEQIVVPAEAVRPKPERLSFEEAAAYPAAYLTAYVALVRRGGLQAGDTLLVHGASGGVGLAALDLSKVLGATVIATTGRPEKMDALRAAGADHVLPAPGFREAVKDLTGGRGADVIYDPVGGDVFDESVRCIAFDGRLLVVGFTSGRIPSVSVNMPLIKGFSVVGVRAGEYGRVFPDRGRENVAAVDALAAEGRIRPRVDSVHPLGDAVAAMRRLLNRQVVGKVVLTTAQAA
jgi:NADPH2:quinone reductase